MSISQEQQERLIAYFEGKLSAEDEIGFLHAVKDDKALQKEFDWELLLRYQQFKDYEADKQDQPEEFEPADAHINRVKEAWKQAGTYGPAQPAPVVRFRVFAVAAAIIILFLGAALLYTLYFKRQSPELVHRDSPVKPDSVRMHEEKKLPVPENKDRILAENNDKAERVYKQYYHKYTGSEEDPIQVSKFLYAYSEGQYDEVIKGTAKELSGKGASVNTPVLEMYLGFYQGISYLHIQKTAPAVNKLREVVSQASVHDQIYYDASWYLAMAYIQSGDLKAATYFLKQLADSKTNTSYKKRAGSILKLL